MPVLLDLEKEIVPDGQDRDLELGVPIELTEAQTSEVVMTKYVSMDPHRADFQPEGIWYEQVTTDVGGKGRSDRITVPNIDGESTHGVNINDGLIIDIHGTLAGIVGLLPGRPPMQQREVEDYMEATGDAVPTFQQWDFRIVKVRKTNGPELRMQMGRTEDQKRKTAEAAMFSSQQEFFQGMMEMFKAGQLGMNEEGEIAPSADAVVKKGLKLTEGK